MFLCSWLRDEIIFLVFGERLKRVIIGSIFLLVLMDCVRFLIDMWEVFIIDFFDNLLIFIERLRIKSFFKKIDVFYKVYYKVKNFLDILFNKWVYFYEDSYFFLFFLECS